MTPACAQDTPDRRVDNAPTLTLRQPLGLGVSIFGGVVCSALGVSTARTERGCADA